MTLREVLGSVQTGHGEVTRGELVAALHACSEEMEESGHRRELSTQALIEMVYRLEDRMVERIAALAATTKAGQVILGEGLDAHLAAHGDTPGGLS